MNYVFMYYILIVSLFLSLVNCACLVGLGFSRSPRPFLPSSPACPFLIAFLLNFKPSHTLTPSIDCIIVESRVHTYMEQDRHTRSRTLPKQIENHPTCLHLHVLDHHTLDKMSDVNATRRLLNLHKDDLQVLRYLLEPKRGIE